MPSPGLSALVCDGAILACEAQAHLLDLHGESPWNVDLDAGVFEFTGDRPGAYGVQLLDTAAQGPASWLWGWANPGGFPEGVLRAANATREVGDQYRVAELATGEIPFEQVPDGEAEPGMRLASSLATAARVVSGRWFAYSGQAGPGTRAWMLLEGLTLPAPSTPRTVRSIGEALTAYELNDHRRAVTSYATLRQLPFDGTRLSLPDGEVRVEFDEHGRISGMQGSAGPA